MPVRLICLAVMLLCSKASYAYELGVMDQSLVGLAGNIVVLDVGGEPHYYMVRSEPGMVQHLKELSLSQVQGKFNHLGTTAKRWACEVNPRPKEVGVSMGALSATWETAELCN